MLKEKKGADKQRAMAAKARKQVIAAKAKINVMVPPEYQEDEKNYDHKQEACQNSSTVKKRAEVSERQQVAADWRAESRKLAKQEEEELERNLLLKKLGKEKVNTNSKVTKFELEIRQEEQKKAIKMKIAERNRRMTREEEYQKMVLVKNKNKDEQVIDAHTIDEAINQLCVADDYMKESKLGVLFKAFEKEQLPKLKEEKPGLSDSQYKSSLWKLWKRSGYAGEKNSIPNSNGNKYREERKSRGKDLVWESY